MTAAHGWLVTHITHEKHIYKHYLGLDASACDLLRPAMYGAYHHITIIGKEGLPHDEKVDVIGSLCENNDKFAVDRMLPKAEVGDILVIHDTGAHGLSMGYNYNGKLKGKEVLLKEDGSFQLIRRAGNCHGLFCHAGYRSGMEAAEKQTLIGKHADVVSVRHAVALDI